MHVSVPPAVMLTQSADRQLSVKPDGTKFSHAHAHHPSAGGRGIGTSLGSSTSRRGTGGGPGSCSRCVQMHRYQAGVAPEGPPRGGGVLSVSQVPVGLWITCPRPCPSSSLPRGHQSHYTSPAQQAQVRSSVSPVELRCHSEQMGLQIRDLPPPPHKDVTFRGVPPLAERDW